jgi:replicative DNA helicase
LDCAINEIPAGSDLGTFGADVASENSGKPLPRLCRFSDLLRDFEADVTAAHVARVTGQPRGPVTGLSTLDRELGGALWPGLHIVHGQPGAGKSAFALQVAASCGCPALLVTCEMSPLELLRRLTARVTETYLGRLKNGELRPTDAVGLARRAIASTPLLTLMDATQAHASPLYMRDCAQIAKGNASHLLLVVDSVHSWAESNGTGATEYDALNIGLAALRTLAHQLSCPVLVIAERNRENMKNEGMSAGAGTRKIEYGAETVIALHRDPESREDVAGEVRVKARFAKNRNGAAGKEIPLRFHGALQRFREDLDR